MQVVISRPYEFKIDNEIEFTIIPYKKFGIKENENYALTPTNIFIRCTKGEELFETLIKNKFTIYIGQSKVDSIILKNKIFVVSTNFIESKAEMTISCLGKFYKVCGLAHFVKKPYLKRPENIKIESDRKVRHLPNQTPCAFETTFSYEPLITSTERVNEFASILSEIKEKEVSIYIGPYIVKDKYEIKIQKNSIIQLINTSNRTVFNFSDLFKNSAFCGIADVTLKIGDKFYASHTHSFQPKLIQI